MSDSFFNTDFFRSLTTTFLGAGVATSFAIGIAYVTFILRNRREKQEALEASRNRQLDLITVLGYEFFENQDSLRAMGTALNMEPTQVVLKNVYFDVWNSVQSEMVHLGLPVNDDTLPTIINAYRWYMDIHHRVEKVENISLDIHLGRLRRSKASSQFLEERTNVLKRAIGEAEAEGQRAMDFLTAYEKHLIDAGNAPSTPWWRRWQHSK